MQSATERDIQNLRAAAAHIRGDVEVKDPDRALAGLGLTAGVVGAFLSFLALMRALA